MKNIYAKGNARHVCKELLTYTINPATCRNGCGVAAASVLTTRYVGERKHPDNLS
ncbi:MAG: hypothetical protein U5K00_00820 [Melioribacteraceae bacterium]|nr:hypothetical protein [Melioribacteraceae bacterium]